MRVQVCFSALHRTIENTVYNYFKNENKSNKNECHKLTPDCELWKTFSGTTHQAFVQSQNFFLVQLV